MNEHEAYVRSKWENVEFRPGNRYHPGMKGGRIYAKHPIANAEWILSGNINFPFEQSKLLSEPDAWKAAYEFTIAREEEIRQAQREWDFLFERIGFQSYWENWCIDGPYVPERDVPEVIRGHAVWSRIFAHAEIRLAELKKGMKP